MTLPRKYRDIASVKIWDEWRKEYVAHIAQESTVGTDAADASEDKTNAGFMSQIMQKLAEAQDTNGSMNERRRKHFRKAVVCLSWSVFGLLIQAGLYLALYRQNLYLQGATL